MVEVIWVEPALNDLDAIADYIALDNPDAAGHSNIRTKIFWTMCRNPISPFVVIVKAGQLARLKTIYRRQYAAISDFWLPPRQL
jgi:hypothetical protein